jgi:hypothetical protein
LKDKQKETNSYNNIKVVSHDALPNYEMALQSLRDNSSSRLKEHENAKWLTKEHLDEVEWLPADVILIDKIRMDMYEDLYGTFYKNDIKIKFGFNIQ